MNPPPASVPARTINVYVDFDGTIAPDEPTDRLFDRFANPAWRVIDEAWLDGTMTSWEATTRKVSLLRASPPEVADFLRQLRIDPAFPAFVDLCRRNGVRLTVVSDGLDLVIHTMLAAAGFVLPCMANQLVWRGGDRWAVHFPFRSSACEFRLGNCKCAHLAVGADLDVMVGDGRSDFCIGQRCGLVIAKGSLLQRCRRQGLPHIAMHDFAEATAQFSTWLSMQHAEAPDAGASLMPAAVGA